MPRHASSVWQSFGTSAATFMYRIASHQLVSVSDADAQYMTTCKSTYWHLPTSARHLLWLPASSLTWLRLQRISAAAAYCACVARSLTSGLARSFWRCVTIDEFFIAGEDLRRLGVIRGTAYCFEAVSLSGQHRCRQLCICRRKTNRQMSACNCRTQPTATASVQR